MYSQYMIVAYNVQALPEEAVIPRVIGDYRTKFDMFSFTWHVANSD